MCFIQNQKRLNSKFYNTTSGPLNEACKKNSAIVDAKFWLLISSHPQFQNKKLHLPPKKSKQNGT